MNTVTNLKLLYEIDDSLWLEKIIELLKEKKFEILDLENLIEELEDLESEKKHKVVSFLEQIIRHSLLLQFWTTEREYNQDHWESEILNFQIQLKRHLTMNLRKYLDQQFLVIYDDAVSYVRRKTQNRVDFPPECPYTLDNLLDPNWLPPYE